MRPAATAGKGAAVLLDSWADHIADLLNAQWDQMVAHHWKPASNSPLEQHRAALGRKFGPGGTWDGLEAEAAGAMATFFLAVSGQHLDGIRALLLARQATLPVAPVARSIVEAAGHTFWLLDPTLRGGRDRVARLYMTKLDNLERNTRTAKAWNTNPGQVEKLVLKKKRFRNLDIPNRFYDSEVVNDDGTITIRGQHLPGLGGSLRYIAAGMGTEDWYTPMYAYLSDSTHPTLYATMETLLPPNDPTHSHHQRFGSADLRREYMIVQAAVHAFQQSWLLVTAYYGLDQAPVIAAGDKWAVVAKPASATSA